MAAIVPSSTPPDPARSERSGDLPRAQRRARVPALHSRVPVAIDVLFPVPIGALTYLPPLKTVTGQDEGGELAARRWTEDVIGSRVVVQGRTPVKSGGVRHVHSVDSGRGVELRHALQLLGTRPWISHATLRGIESIARGVGATAGQILATLGLPGLALNIEHE